MYIVDEQGRAEPGSVQVLRSTHPELLAAVRAALSVSRYAPARMNGQPVRQVMVTGYDFGWEGEPHKAGADIIIRAY